MIKDCVVEYNFDLLVIIEIWFDLGDKDIYYVRKICLIVYDFYYILRVDLNGGGVGLFVKKFL